MGLEPLGGGGRRASAGCGASAGWEEAVCLADRRQKTKVAGVVKAKRGGGGGADGGIHAGGEVRAGKTRWRFYDLLAKLGLKIMTF